MALKSMGDETEIRAQNGRLVVVEGGATPVREALASGRPAPIASGKPAAVGRDSAIAGFQQSSRIELVTSTTVPAGAVEMRDADGKLIAVVCGVAEIRAGFAD